MRGKARDEPTGLGIAVRFLTPPYVPAVNALFDARNKLFVCHGIPSHHRPTRSQIETDRQIAAVPEPASVSTNDDQAGGIGCRGDDADHS